MVFHPLPHRHRMSTPTLSSITPAPLSQLGVVSWNVAGLNTPVKRKKVLTHLKRLHPQIVFLQETHWKEGSSQELKAPWIGTCLTASFCNKTRGVAILFHKDLPISIHETHADPEGRFLYVDVTIYSTRYSLLNLYAPNCPNVEFYSSLYDFLLRQQLHPLIIGGDFNVTLQPDLDRSQPSTQDLSTIPTLLSLISQFTLCDPWRTLNSSVKDFTFYSHAHNSHSRIDFFPDCI